MQIPTLNWTPGPCPTAYLNGLDAIRQRVADPCLGTDFHQELSTLTSIQWPACVEQGRRILRTLNSEPGAVIILRLPGWEDELLRDFLFLSLALCVRPPITHDRERVIWEISPKSRECVVPTYSETTEEAPLHTDGTYKEDPPRFIANLVVQSAAHGGETFLAEGHEVCREFRLTLEGPRHLEFLQQSFPFRLPSAYDTPGGATTTHGIPVKWEPLCLRFRPDVLRAGLDVLKEPGDSDRRKAIAAFADFLKNYPEKLETRLEEGAMLFIDNRRVLHGRRAFTGPRHLRRIWMR